MGSETGLTELLKRNVTRVEQKVSQYRSRYDRILITSVVSSGAATLIAGVTSAVGEAANIGTEGWRLACIIAAVFGFVSTVSSGIIQQKNFNDRLSEGKECLSRLRYLNTVIVTGSRELSDISREYEELAVKYPELLG
jgi:hypothetical protein